MIFKKSRWTLLLTLMFVFFSTGSIVYANDDQPVSEMFNLQNNLEDNNSNENATADPSPSFGTLLFRTVVTLAIIIALIVLLSKWISKKGQSFEMTQYMSIKAGINLGQNKSLRLVKIGSSYYLLGIGNDVRLLKEFSTEDELADIEAFQYQNDSPSKGYAKSIQNVFALLSKKPNEDERSFQSQLEDRLSDFRSNSNQNKDKQQDREGMNL